MSKASATTVLFLTANPTDTRRLAAGEEFRRVRARVETSDEHDAFELVYVPEVRADELVATLLRHAPHVVHFTGHGDDEGRLVLPDAAGRATPVDADAVRRLFAALAGALPLRCVVLNACHSAALAEAVSAHVPYVVGVPGEIPDAVAVAFAGAFYEALAFGRDVPAAFDLALVQLRLVGADLAAAPALYARDASPSLPPPPPPPPVPAATSEARADDAIHPRVDDLFVGRDRELAAARDALRSGDGRVVALQGPAGVGKSYLADRVAYELLGRFPGGYVEVTLAADDVDVEALGARAASALRLPWGVAGAWGALRARLRAPATLVHVESVDDEAQAAAAGAFVARVAGCATLVTGRYRGLGEAAGWTALELEPFDDDTVVALLSRRLARPPPRDEMVRLGRALGGLPLALHLAAGHLAAGLDIDAFLRRLRRDALGTRPRDPADPLALHDGARAVLRDTFELSLHRLADELGGGARADRLLRGLAALAWLPPSGFGRSLGAAVAGLGDDDFDELVDRAVTLSIASATAPPRRADRAWTLPPLMAELLRARSDGDAWRAHVSAWALPRLPKPASQRDEAAWAAWAELSRERDALAAWLTAVPDVDAPRVAATARSYALRHGPYPSWVTFYTRLAATARDEGLRATALGGLCEAALRASDYARARDAAREVLRVAVALGDARGEAFAREVEAAVDAAQGDLDRAREALEREVIPRWDAVGAGAEGAVARTRLGDILRMLGRPADALRVLEGDAVPTLARLGLERQRAVALGHAALACEDLGDLERGLALLRDEVVPACERLGDARERAVALRRLADLLQKQGAVEASLTLLREEVIPTLERLGDARERAVALRLEAAGMQRSGRLEEALARYRDEVIPAFEALGEQRLLAATYTYAARALTKLGRHDEALALLRERVDPFCAAHVTPVLRARTAVQRAYCLRNLGRHDEALAALEGEAVPAFEAMGFARELAHARSQMDKVRRLRAEAASGG